MIALLCRVCAVAIIIVGVIDPAWTASRAISPAVAVIDAGTADSKALADRVAAALGRDFTITRRVTPDAGAVVVAGRVLPRFAETITTPSFAVTPSGADVRIVAVDLPARGHVNARVPVDVRVRAWHSRGGTLSVSLASGGVTVDSVTRPIDADDATIDVPLTLSPSSIGTAAVRVSASLAGDVTGETHADSLIRVDDRPWPVLVFDRRPSYLSTFVRRAIEGDGRFTVTSRTATSVGVSTDTAGAPATLTNTAALANFDAIVIGAPDALAPVDVASLDAFLRRRGGSVVLLWDAAPAGAAASIAGVTKWTNDTLAADAAVDTPYGALRASELARPAGASAALTTVAPVGAAGPPLIWSAPVGQGRVIVNGALDSWRYRTSDNTAFDRVWRSIVADAAGRAPAPLTVTLDARDVAPATRVSVTIRARDAAGEYVDSAIPATVASARLTDAAGKIVAALRVWPGDTPGVYRAEVIAPDAPGDFHVIAAIGPARPGAASIESDADLRVSADAASVADVDAVGPWAAARSGAVFDEVRLADLTSALHRTVTTTRAVDTTHPMRSPWWILPVTLLLGAEWWTRRRNGRR